MHRNRKKATAVALAVGVLAIAGCSSEGGAQEESGGGGGGEGESFTIAMITHEAPGAAFWDRVRSGAEQPSPSSPTGAPVTRCPTRSPG